MNKYSPLLFVMIFSFLFGDDNVQIRLQNGQISKGEFIGTYMNHVHILVEEKIIYYACDDIISITYTSSGWNYGQSYDYDCNLNTVTADILFPPEFDPKTGEMMQMLPDVFNPDIPKPVVSELIKDQKDSLYLSSKKSALIANAKEGKEGKAVFTKEGKEILLFDDGTWQDLEKNSVSNQVQTNETQIFITKSGKKNNLDGVKYNKEKSIKLTEPNNICDQAIIDANKFESELWYLGGIMYPFGIAAFKDYQPKPNQHILSNMTNEDRLVYQECYNDAAKKVRLNRMYFGCCGLSFCFSLYFLMFPDGP